MGRSKPDQKYRNGNCTLGRRGNEAVVSYPDENGKRQRTRLGVPFSDMAAAERALNIFAEAQRAVRKQQASYTVGQLWEMWLEERAADRLRNDIYNANWVALGPSFASRSPDLLNAQDFRDYAELRFRAGKASWTVHTELSRLRSCLKWAVETHLIARRPKVWVPTPGKHRERVLSFDEARALVAGALKGDPHVYLFVVVAFATGARHGALLDLVWERIDFAAGLIAFDEVLKPDPMSKSWRKGRALVPMNRAARMALETAFAGRQTRYVIEHGGRRLKSIRCGFAAAVERAGLFPAAGITPHTIRHTVASWLEDRVNDARRAQLLGHSGMRTLPVYTHSGAELLVEAVSLLDAEFAPLPKIAHEEAETEVRKELVTNSSELGASS